MRRASLAAVLLLAAAIARAGMPYKDPAEERPLNPDRWTTLELDESGMSPWKADQIVYPPSKPETDSRRQSLDVAAAATGLFPLTDAFTLTLGLGGDWSETQTANAGANGSTTNDSSLLTYRGGGRWYFEDLEADAEPWHFNPDRWPSLGLLVSGTQLVNYSAGNATGNSAAESAANSQAATLDARWPVAEAWTVTASAGGARSEIETQSDPSAPRTVNLTGGWAASAGVRWFAIERSLIVDDHHRNPDMWPMLALALSGGRSTYGRQTLAAGKRDTSSMSESATVSARVPVTDHASFLLSAQVQYSRSYAPPLGTAVGALTRASTLNVTAGVRYFLF